MYKVLIVDDEIYIVALIQRLVDWEKYGMKLEATANDGITALKLVQEINPDLVIVDVRMPGYDGISFMDKVREFDKRVNFIVISGHKQFDYAKGAMRSNVEDYLLKPINKEELEAVLSRVHKKLEVSRQEEKKLKAIEEKLDSSQRRIRETLVHEVLSGDFGEAAADLDSINEEYLSHFRPGKFRLGALILNTPAHTETTNETTLIVRETQKSLQERLALVCTEEIDYEFDHNVIIFLLNYQNEDEGKVIAIMNDQLAKSNQYLKKFKDVYWQACLGGSCESLFDLKDGVNEMWRSVYARSGMNGRKIIEPADIKDAADMLPALLESNEAKVMQALYSLDEEALMQRLKEMFTRAFYGVEEDSLLYYKLYMKLVDIIYGYFKGIGVRNKPEAEFKRELERYYIRASGGADYSKILSREVHKIIEDNSLSSEKLSTPIIRIVKKYISEHYKENISLIQAAQAVNLAPAYLSRLFKKETGINFLDYLNQYRIGKAKQLLQDVKYNVIKTAEMSGFRDTRYFSKIFKKTVGITPTEYRKRHLNEGDM